MEGKITTHFCKMCCEWRIMDPINHYLIILCFLNDLCYLLVFVIYFPLKICDIIDRIHFIVVHYNYFPFYQFLNYVFHASLLLLHFAETRIFMVKVLLPGDLKSCLSICSVRNSYTPEKSLSTLSSSDVNMGSLLYKKYTLVQSQTTFLAFKIDSNLLINLDCGTKLLLTY